MSGIPDAISGGVSTLDALVSKTLQDVLDNLNDLKAQPGVVLGALTDKIGSLLGSVSNLSTETVTQIIKQIDIIITPLIGTVASVGDGVLLPLAALLDVLLFAVENITGPFTAIDLFGVIEKFHFTLAGIYDDIATSVCKIEKIEPLSSLKPSVDKILGAVVNNLENLTRTCPLDSCTYLVPFVTEVLKKIQQCKA